MAKNDREYDVEYVHRIMFRMPEDTAEALKASCKENMRTQTQELNYVLRKYYGIDKKKK